MDPKRMTPRETSRREGFTLIEIMAVVVIMGMLMAVLAVGVTSQIDKARRSTAQAGLNRIEQALQFYQMDNARFPTSDQGLEALASKPSSPPEPRDYPPAGYLKRDALMDPWQNPYKYRIPGSNNPHAFDLWSVGADGADGTEDDVVNWDTGGNT